MSNSSVLLALSLFVQDASLKYATENNLSEAQNYMQLWRQNGEKMDVKASLKIYLMMELFLKRMVLMANTSTIFREGANKQVISSQADSLIKISRIWADFFPANNRISLFRLFFPPFLALFPVFTEISPTDVSFGPPETGWPG
ncbi:hypothetical protein NE241_24635 [Klebsiella pneumoniae]|nr:hypothetical protein NE241_24635 [Klebsiella pneumoniae]